MGKALDKFLNIMRLTDDEYDDDLDEELDEALGDDLDDEEAEERRPAPKPKKEKKKRKPLFGRRKKAPVEDDDYDEFDIDEPVYEAEPAHSYDSSYKKSIIPERNDRPQKAEKAEPVSRYDRPARQEAPARGSKIVPMKQQPASSARRADSVGVIVLKPKGFEEAYLIADALIKGQSTLIIFEGIDNREAQRIIDFTSGIIYTLRCNIKQVSMYTFIITPEYVDITGDIEEAFAQTKVGNVPTFNING